jgi:hypothetical protein
VYRHFHQSSYVLYAFFWVIPRRLNFVYRRFGTLHRRISILSAHEDGTESSETSAYKIQTPGNYPEESIQHSEHGESLKSRSANILLHPNHKNQDSPHKINTKNKKKGIKESPFYFFYFQYVFLCLFPFSVIYLFNYLFIYLFIYYFHLYIFFLTSYVPFFSSLPLHFSSLFLYFVYSLRLFVHTCFGTLDCHFSCK